MNRSALGDAELESLLRELTEVKGEALLEEEADWHDRVPEAFRAAGLAALALARPRKRTPPLAGRPLIAALSLVTAAAVAAGAYAASPALRAAARGLFPPQAVSTEAPVSARAPGGYVIPSPGADYTLWEGTDTETLQYRWFTAGERAVLVEIAYRLPNGNALPADAQPVVLDRLVGWGYEQDGAQFLLLRDGETSILLSMIGGDKEALWDYAELFAEANQNYSLFTIH